MTDKSNNTSLASYDDFPYESYSFAHSRPEHIRTVGLLFGMKPPAIETARVLELGCASGGNIINFATIYPKSYTLGVDLSKVEVDQGIKRINDLGLKNIELKHMSITDIDESYGKFDYIICHGVFSWVPSFVRDKILEISKKLLNPEGISFISYNTLPGWNMVNTIRDMMLFHSSMFKDDFNKVQQAKLFLNFVTDSLGESDTSYIKFLKEEAVNLAQREDSYLRHEYLAEENKQFYFHEFIDLAKAQELNYLGESNFHAMFLGNLPTKAVEKLKDIQDIVRTEQYMDFIQNRRFRCTLLCHNNITLNRNITPESMKGFYLQCNLVPEKLESEIEINNSLENIFFYLNNDKSISVSSSSPIMKAIFYTYVDNIGNVLTAEELFNLAQKKLPKFKKQDFEQEFNAIIAKLVFSGYVKLFATKPVFVYKISKKPKVSDLALYQIKHAVGNKFWITTQINEVFAPQIHQKFVLELLDGTNSLEQLNEKILDKFISGEMTANDGDKKVTDPELLKQLAKECVDSSLELFKKNYILVG